MPRRLVFPIPLGSPDDPERQTALGAFAGKGRVKWQEWRDSNPRPSVLETDALPAELHSCSGAPFNSADWLWQGGSKANVL